jgi:hypothetical protein
MNPSEGSCARSVKSGARDPADDLDVDMHESIWMLRACWWLDQRSHALLQVTHAPLVSVRACREVPS